jgi:hypothetical protein
MRPPRPRFTIRRLMIAVVAIALILGLEATRRRWMGASTTYHIRAEGYWRKARDASEKAWRLALTLRSDDAPEIAREQRLADHWGSLMKKYRRLADRPWLPVEPDPPEPK